jgi:drug/metabolite transporter, DME family
MRPALLVLLAALLWGTTGTAQALGPTGLNPLLVGAGRLVLGGALLAAFATITGAWRDGAGATSAGRVATPAPQHRAGLPWLALAISAGCVATYQLCFFAAVERAGVAVGTLIAIGSAPVFTGLVGWLTRQGRPGSAWFAATALAVAGAALLVLGAPTGDAGRRSGGTADLLGMALALGAGLSYAGYAVGGKRMVDRMHSPTAAMAAVFGAGGALLLPVLVAVLLADPPPTERLAGATTVIIYLAVIPTALAYLLFGRGLAALPAALVATLSLAEPLVASTLGVVVLGEPMTAVRAAGALLIFTGLGLSVLAARPRTLSG